MAFYTIVTLLKAGILMHHFIFWKGGNYEINILNIELNTENNNNDFDEDTCIDRYDTLIVEAK